MMAAERQSGAVTLGELFGGDVPPDFADRPVTDLSADSRRVRPGGLFLAIALALPLLLLGGLELGLRAVDAAPRQPLFIVHPQHPEFSLANPRVIERFFARAEAAPNVSVETGYFRSELRVQLDFSRPADETPAERERREAV